MWYTVPLVLLWVGLAYLFRVVVRVLYLLWLRQIRSCGSWSMPCTTCKGCTRDTRRALCLSWWCG